MVLPRPRGHLITEQRNPRSSELDRLSVREILELINAEDATIAAAVKGAIPRIEQFVERVAKALLAGGRLIYVGAGTSGRLGVLDAAECPPTFSVAPEMVVGLIAGGPPALTSSIEGAEDRPEDGSIALAALNPGPNDCVLGIATGGTTPFVHGALELARQRGAFTGFLVCTSESGLEALADVIIPVVVGPEVITGSTRMKAGTATKLVLNMISTTAMVKLHKTYGNLMVDLKALNDKLWERGSRIVAEITGRDFEAAYKLLQAAEGDVKAALVMNHRDESLPAARRRLEAGQGDLRQVLEAGD